MALSPSRPIRPVTDQHRAVGQDDDQAGDQPDLQDVAEGSPAEAVLRPVQAQRRLRPDQPHSIQTAARAKEITAARGRAADAELPAGRTSPGSARR